MKNLYIRKRFKNSEAVYEYRFEIAILTIKENKNRKAVLKTVTDARRAGMAAMR